MNFRITAVREGGRERERGRKREREGGREGGKEGREKSVYSVIHPHSLELSCVGNWSQYLGLSSNKLDNRELFKPGTAPQVANIIAKSHIQLIT